MNRYLPHVYVIPEDDRDRQIANGFVGHNRVNALQIKVMPCAGGWRKVLGTFLDEYVQALKNYPSGIVVLLIDFDGHVSERRGEFENAIPDDLKARVFVVGAKYEPESLKKALKLGFENIGASLAEDCCVGTTELWNHEHLKHNDAEIQRLVRAVGSFVLPAPN